MERLVNYRKPERLIEKINESVQVKKKAGKS
jgi:hypothetical protein